MGTIHSALTRLRITFVTLKALRDAYQNLSTRISLSPGLPAENPCTPYWALPPASIAQHGLTESPPDYADIVIIGSGITGTSVARNLLRECNGNVRVVMLEARDACSGATARNGGHITPPLWHGYQELKKLQGAAQAKSIVRFRLAHLEEMLRIAEEEDPLNESQCRKVQTFDVFYKQHMFERSKESLRRYLEDFPEEIPHWAVLEKDDAIQGLQLSSKVAGVITTIAGALHPYRLVTGILLNLLKLDSFELYTHTPCTNISPPSESCDLYTISTPKGSISTPHIIHATNGWASHLLEPMRTKIVPIRGNMTAQSAGQGLGCLSEQVPILTPLSTPSTWLGSRSFIFYHGDTYESMDYLSQQPINSNFSRDPDSRYPPSTGELMFGGGLIHGGIAEQTLFEEVGNVDDRGWHMGISAYLGGALPVYFGTKSWGKETEEDGGRIKKEWSGILGISADTMPWVGRLPPRVSGRPAPSSSAGEEVDGFVFVEDENEESESKGLTAPGEWISAGYSGEGMVHAWMCGKALAYMVLGKDGTENDGIRRNTCDRATILDGFTPDGVGMWFPEAFRVTEERWRKADIEDFV